MQWNVGTKISTGFGITLAIFLVVGALAYRNATELVSTNEWTRHTYEALDKLARLPDGLRSLELAQRNFVITGEPKLLEEFTASQRALEQAIEDFRSFTADNPRQQAHVSRLDPIIRNRVAIANSVVETRRNQGLEAAIESIKTGRGRAARDQALAIVEAMRAEENRLLAIRRASTELDARNVRAGLLYGMLIAVLLSAIAGTLIARSIAVPLGRLTGIAERISSGDLKAEVVFGKNRKDEVGILTTAFERMTAFLRTMATAAEQIAAGDLRANIQPRSSQDQLGNAFVRMTENLRKQLGSMAENASVLGAVASQIVASTSQLVSGASQSAAAVSETTTTVEEIRQTAQMATQKSKTVSENAQKAVLISQDGRRSTEDVITGMNRIRSQMEAIGESMMRLSEQGQTIGQIIATVEDLSAQSNLLAVNAAIEAAKAGEHGKGFGVVAQEVKSLAEQSRAATDRVRTILGDIQKATTAAVLATEQGGRAVEAGGQQTGGAAESIQQLAGTVAEAAQAATQIAASSQQQLVGMDQVAVAMESIKQASTQNVVSARQLESAARNLNDLGQRLKQSVAQYAV
jgi:methyl-accepting chemotaxis protein